MKRLFIFLAVLLVTLDWCYAVIVTSFVDTDMFVERARDIVIARYLPGEEADSAKFENGLHLVQVEILLVLKGNKQPGRMKVATIYYLKPGESYMLTSSGGSAYGTDFLAIPQLSVVPLPFNFDLKILEGKNMKEQVQAVFSRRLFEVEQALSPLQKEESLLTKALQDRKDDIYQSNTNVKVKTIFDAVTKRDKGIPYLDFKSTKIEWSHNEPGKSGSLYFTKNGSNTPLWEFSPSTYREIKEFDSKPLTARFYGMYSPGMKNAFGRSGEPGIRISVGQIVLARTIDDPLTIYIIQIEKQDEVEEKAFVKYAIIRN